MDVAEYSEYYRTGFEKTLIFLRARGVPLTATEDAAQAAWFKAWVYRDRLNDPAAIVAWTKITALRLFQMGLRKGDERCLQFDHDEHGKILRDYLDTDPIEVSRLLERCTPRDRMLLEQQLCGFEPYELANGQSEIAVRVRMHRARRAALTMLMTPQKSPSHSKWRQ